MIDRYDLEAFGASLWRAISAVTRRWPLAMSAVYVSLFSGLSYLVIDRPLALWLKANLTPHVEGFFKVVTEFGEAELFIVPAVLLGLFFRMRAWRAVTLEARALAMRYVHLALFLLACLAASGIVVNGLKFLVGRFRPRYLFEQGLYGFEPFNTAWAMNSFPSGHSQAIWAVMMALLFIVPRYDLLWVLVAVLVAMSRVVTTVHYLSDVVMGSYIAIALSILVHRAFVARGISVRVRMRRDERLL